MQLNDLVGKLLYIEQAERHSASRPRNSCCAIPNFHEDLAVGLLFSQAEPCASKVRSQNSVWP